MRASFRPAMRAAWRERHLVVLLWASHLALAFLALAPFRAHLSKALALSPEGDRLVTDFDLPLLLDLARGAGALATSFGPILGAVGVAALLWNALAAGGAIETLRFADGRPLAVRFGRGAGRYFARFLRMGLVATPLALLVAATVSSPFWIARLLIDEAAQRPAFWLGIATLFSGMLGFTLALLALDLARIRVARSESRRAIRIYLATLRSLLRRPVAVFRAWIGLFLALALALAVLGVLRHALPDAGSLAFFTTLALQQAATLTRAAYRVALWAAEIALDART